MNKMLIKIKKKKISSFDFIFFSNTRINKYKYKIAKKSCNFCVEIRNNIIGHEQIN